MQVQAKTAKKKGHTHKSMQNRTRKKNIYIFWITCIFKMHSFQKIYMFVLDFVHSGHEKGILAHYELTILQMGKIAQRANNPKLSDNLSVPYYGWARFFFMIYYCLSIYF